MEIIKSFYENGKLEKVGELINGQKQGLWTYFYENGKKRLEVNFKDDKYEGLFIEWYEDGSLAEEGEYRNGEYLVINFWLESGEQILEDGTGMTIRKFGASQGDIFEQHFKNGKFIKEVKIAGVSYGKFIPNNKLDNGN